MGLRRLRARLDQLQGEANETMALAQDLVADLKDGFGVTVEVDSAKLTAIARAIFSGTGLPKQFELPVTIKVDPTVDA